jgi:enamine deaminase RidA (YjgF/YER057c/UK114 family)
MSVYENLKKLGIGIPDISSPIGSYLMSKQAGDYIYISGQLSKQGDKVLTGKLGKDVSIEEGKKAAEAAFLNALAVLNNSCESLDEVEIIKLTGFVNSSDDFTSHPDVINGASNLAFAIFAEKGRHARAAVGVNSLPLNAICEVELIARIIRF